MNGPSAVLIDQLQAGLSLEDQWVARDGAEQRWWLTAAPTRVWAEPLPHIDGGPWVRLHAQTTVAVGVDATSGHLLSLADQNMSAIMSALTLDARTRALSLRCAATFDTSRPSGGRLDLFRAALLYQASIAHYADFSELVSGTRVTAEHPSSGQRAEPIKGVTTGLAVTRMVSDEELTIVPSLLSEIESGMADYVLWSIQGDGRLSFEVNAGSTEPRVWRVATGDDGTPWDPEASEEVRVSIRAVSAEKDEDPALMHQILWGTGERPGAPQTAALRISSKDEHPVVGNGLLLALLMPGLYPMEQATRMANGLNLREGVGPLRSHRSEHGPHANWEMVGRSSTHHSSRASSPRTRNQSPASL